MEGKAIFFGDSITAGEKAEGKSFSEYLEFDEKLNLGVSGTTIGEYSIYPVEGNSLLSQIAKCEDNIKEANYIFLEYGINDASAICSKYVDIKRMQIDFVKAIDYIKQLNNSARIFFLALSTEPDVVEKFAKNHVKYLNEEYLVNIDKVNALSWIKGFFNVLSVAGKKCEKINMISDRSFLDKYMDEDNIHPNAEGQKLIAEAINKYLNEN